MVARPPRSWVVLALVVLYVVLAPSIFLLGPLLLLLLVSGPRALREWVWISASALGLSVWAQTGSDDLPVRMLQAAGVLFSGAMGASALAWPSTVSPLARLGAAVTFMAGGVAVWAAVLGIGVADVTGAIAAQTVAMATLLLQGNPSPSPEIRGLLESVIQTAPASARLAPGVLVLAALAGGGLAWTWYHRVAVTPRGRPPRAYAEFRFDDRLVWGAIITLAVVLAPVPDRWNWLGGNLLLVWIGLYVFRGGAVLWSLVRRAPVFVRLALLLGGILLLPFASGGLLALGLADTWVDLRQRFARASTP